MFGELQDCAERELKRRRRYYPNRIMTKRMSRRDANDEIAMMLAITILLAALADKERLL